MLETGKKIWKCVLFCVLSLILVSQLNRWFLPRWEEWNNYNTLYGFYEEPRNTIDTVFLGTSTTVNGITPMELYRDYGICAYNLATEQQPAYASLAWLNEAYRYHKTTLKTVVMDVSCLRRNLKAAMFRKAMSPLRFSKTKFDIAMKYTGNITEALEYLLPVYAYHSRWDSMEKTDFQKYYVKPASYLRGYHYDNSQEYFLTKNLSDICVPADQVDEGSDIARLNESSVEAFLELVSYCRKKNLNLILMKVPSGEKNWKKSEHDAVVRMLEEEGLDEEIPFLDMNFQPLLGETGYDHILDSVDNLHMNDRGAKKVTAYIGRYLTEQGLATDVRNDSRYDYLKEELEAYESYVLQSELRMITDPAEYLQTVKNSDQDYTILISVCKDAAKGMQKKQRKALKKLGLTKLSELALKEAYVGVISGQKVLFEECAGSQDTTKENEGICYKKVLKDGTGIFVISGKREGNKMLSNFMIDGEQYTLQEAGLHIVVYDMQHKILVDMATFPLNKKAKREDMDYEAELLRNLEKELPLEAYSEQAKKLYQYRFMNGDSYVKEKADLEITV